MCAGTLATNAYVEWALGCFYCAAVHEQRLVYSRAFQHLFAIDRFQMLWFWRRCLVYQRIGPYLLQQQAVARRLPAAANAAAPAACALPS
jgi:hypothetical protein